MIGMFGIASNPSQSKKTHGGGWTCFLKSLCLSLFEEEVHVLNENDNWDDYDLLVYNEGMNYRENKVNLFGGVSDKLIKRLKKFNNYKGKVICFGPKLDWKIIAEQRNIDIDLFYCPNIDYYDPSNLHDKLVLGDSHTLAVYKHGFGLQRVDGKTLHGFLKDGIETYIKREDLKELIFYAGNIDIRHHLNRQPNPLNTALSLIDRLETQLIALNVPKISVVCVLPIENELRKLPKSIMYKDKPFAGGWHERHFLVHNMNESIRKMCKRNNWECIEWPDHFRNDKAELSFTVMEQRQSVHIAPLHYLFPDNYVEKTKQITLGF